MIFAAACCSVIVVFLKNCYFKVKNNDKLGGNVVYQFSGRKWVILLFHLLFCFWCHKIVFRETSYSIMVVYLEQTLTIFLMMSCSKRLCMCNWGTMLESCGRIERKQTVYCEKKVKVYVVCISCKQFLNFFTVFWYELARSVIEELLKKNCGCDGQIVKPGELLTCLEQHVMAKLSRNKEKKEKDQCHR